MNLRSAGIAFAVAVTVHTADHLRRGQTSITEVLYLLGNLSLVLSVVTITLILTDHRLAPLFAAVAGPALAIGFLAAHWLPTWSDVSDPVWEVSSLPLLSVVASAGEVITAAWIGVVGNRIVRQRGLASFGSDEAAVPST